MDTQKSNTGWSDTELEASIDAYLKMWKLEQAGQAFKKSVENRLLREGPLALRSASSIEYRMQNISAVIQQLGWQPITGYVPAKNVGAGVNARIRAVLEAKAVLDTETYTATADEAVLEMRATTLQKRSIAAEPQGIVNPQQVSATSTTYVRDPQVRAWVRQQAKGICEGCGSNAPFEVDGQPFLEVHHVKHLAQKGSDCTSNAVALCPNCHQRCHRSSDRKAFTAGLYSRITRLIPE
ncbi:HNH endonuclease [Pseudomonas sp. CCM 7893]|uniref:HNH endonuclease n=1 Tax=Pseudomonas spelaei TaxID=1055469 RepID=A0A6I3VXJ8_9PSED|nr:HNH endonuclease [Pseudomonas spelaei]MUF03110.1 HNH endonuclease [Pseudomonas spelaei]QLG94543.1 HNH endonuclease [Pseudomonas yamanorum]